MEDLKILYKEMLEREKVLISRIKQMEEENKPTTLAVTQGRHAELQLAIVRVQQLMLKYFKSNKK